MASKVLIGICSSGEIQAETTVCLAELNKQSVGGIFTYSGGYKPHNMNDMAQDGLDGNYTHILSIDPDMMFPTDSLQVLLGADKDIIGLNYMARGNLGTQNNPWPVTKLIDGKGYRSPTQDEIPNGLFECAAVGLGVCLIKTSVFKKMTKPYFYTDYNPGKELKDFRTEDVVFCERARLAGFEVWCDPTLPVGHIGKYVYLPKLFGGR